MTRTEKHPRKLKHFKMTTKLERFNDLSSLLLTHKKIWRFPAFKQLHMHCLDAHPELKPWLLALSDDQVNHLQNHNLELLSEISPYFRDATKIAELINFPATPKHSNKRFSKFWDVDIPGRKAQQIADFCHAVKPGSQSLLEWCSGKQHLGRLLSTELGVTCEGLEIDPQLVRDANQLSKKRTLDKQVRCIECDVLSSNVGSHLRADQHIIALHACGGLHKQLIKKSVLHKVSHLSFSPCCYHRFSTENTYQLLSEAGILSKLILNSDDLRLAVRETKTASKSETAKRKKLQSWRLGFDSLQRHIRNTHNYLDTPSINSKILQTSFQDFCQQLAAIKGIPLHAKIDYNEYETIGSERFHLFERFELLKMIFRRAIETWLVLDMAIFLESQGYRTDVSLFCEEQVSPRNFLIQAFLKKKQGK